MCLALSHGLAEMTATAFHQSCTWERALGDDGGDVVDDACDGRRYTSGDQHPSMSEVALQKIVSR